MQEIKTLSSQWYCDQEIYQRERREIFAKEWIYAAHESELPCAGDYITLEIAGYAIIILRNSEGHLKSFHNVCRHRAAPLLTAETGKLEGKLISCRYHGWSYNQEGCLAATPLFEELPDLKRAELSLYDVQVNTYRGLIFVNLSAEAIPFVDAFGSLTEVMNDSDCSLESYKLHSKLTREGSFNWKVWLDGYQECYHCMTIHPIFNKDFALQKYKIENVDRFSIHSCERKVESPSGSFNGLWLWVYPNLGMPCYEPCYYTLRVNPLAVDRTKLEYTFHVRDTEDTKTIEEFRQFVDQITSEDINVCEAVQKNLKSGIYQDGILNPRRENGVAYYQSLVRQAVEQGGPVKQARETALV
jgi:phenylpropionate dioxygenase-like ring-hydroxylating dioxygenase large terminal subunit